MWRTSPEDSGGELASASQRRGGAKGLNPSQLQFLCSCASVGASRGSECDLGRNQKLSLNPKPGQKLYSADEGCKAG